MMRRSRGLSAAVVLLAAGCSFTESNEISTPKTDDPVTNSSATTTTVKPSGAPTLVKLADGEVPTPTKGVRVANADQLIKQLTSLKTASDLPNIDGRYDLTRRVIVAQPDLIDLFVGWGRLPGAVTTDLTFTAAGTNDPASPQGIKRDVHRKKSRDGAWVGSMVIPDSGPIRLVVADASCCSFVLVRRGDAFSVEVTRSAQTPKTLHIVAVPGVNPIAKQAKNKKYVPPAATAVPIGDVAIPDMTMPTPKTPRPPDITDPPSSPEKLASVQLPPPVPAGSWCGYLASRGVPFDQVVEIWNGLGRPAHMDADANGIPCETRY